MNKEYLSKYANYIGQMMCIAKPNDIYVIKKWKAKAMANYDLSN